MTGLLNLLSRAADRARAPRCRRCDADTILTSEELLPGTPAVLESVFHCAHCGTDMVRCLVAAAND
jgi:hypothetical protein